MTNDLQEIKAHHDALPGPSATAVTMAKDRLTAEVAAERGPHIRSAKQRLLLRAVAVGLAATVGAVAFLVGTDGGETPASAAELLQKAATTADREQQPLPGQFVYVSRQDQSFVAYMSRSLRSDYIQEVDRAAWIPAADPGGALIRSTYGERRALTGRLPTDLPTPGTVEVQRYGRCAVGVFPATSAENLPADPDQLLARVRADAEAAVRNERPDPRTAPLSEEQIRQSIESTVAARLALLAENPFPGPGLRAAVLGALSKMPTATMRTDLTDPAGRQGVGASIRYQGLEGWERTELIFEPGTYRFLGWRKLIEPPGGGPEVLRYATAVLETKVVDAMPKIPAGASEAMTC
ncbi:CU044_5270 family protein [Nonomuraea sp. CA-143628]|uniref:CU044_5270 family protein n=1 Tax=Nonomuraea sp. CA-143628 TaxID=3239997 RepID=UPI003D93D13A